jgi:ribosomal protein S18 acetylase RimI-like enzyme
MTNPRESGVVVYALEPELDAREFIALLRRTTLGPRRPLDDLPRIQRMIDQADIMLTARAGGRLVGISRALTDYSFATYLSDLAVDEAFQGRGIGRELIRRTQEAAGMQAMLVLIAAPQAESYYPHIGMQQHHSCWFIPREEEF